MIALTIAEITAIVGGRISAARTVETFVDPHTVVAGSVQTDSRLVEPGSIFLAMPGEETDGHLYAARAVASGAALVIAEREVDVDVPLILVENGVRALAALARFVVARVHDRGDLTVIAITGSNGKTTSKNMIAAILAEHGPTIAPVDSFNNHVGAPISMLRIDETTRYLVVEMGASHPGEIAHLASIAQPDIAVVLKVGLAHVGEFGGLATTAASKAELVTGLAESAIVILNADDHRVARMASQTRASVTWFGGAASSGLFAKNVETDMSGTSFTLAETGSALQLPVRLQITGDHHAINAVAALSVARAVGIEPATAIPVLEALPRAERWRMELLPTAGGAMVINDAYNASPDSTEAALRTLRQLGRSGGRTIAVLGEMTELGTASAELHAEIGALVATLGIDELLVVGERARGVFTGAAREREWHGRLVFVPTAELAHDLLASHLGADDVVLVKSSKSAGLRFVGDRLAGVPA